MNTEAGGGSGGETSTVTGTAVRNGGISGKVIRYQPLPGENRASRLRHAIAVKKRNPLLPYHEVGSCWRIPPSTLQRHATREVKKRGGQTTFSAEQEAVFARHLLMCADALWPITTEQLVNYIERFVKVYRIPAPRFRNGRPGKDWVAGFLRRHSQLKLRRAHAISASKAWGNDPDKLREFFGRLKPLLVEGPEFCTPDCIINYDETALGDDAGDPYVITRKTSKTPRAVLNNNKANRSVMFAVTGDGEVLPPHVCTKTKFKDEEIAAFGPPQCYYSTSKSGWFTMPVFDEWFECVVVPWAVSKGTRNKMIIGDNLSAHLSPVTLKRASQLGVSFRLLPPNTTGYLQPLDVAVFSPLKGAWRKQLADYKRDTLNKSLLKKHFGQQFKTLCSTITADNIKSGFRATGLIPYDPEAAVSRMPCRGKQTVHDQDGQLLAASLNLNQENRVTTQQRKKKLPPAGSELAPPRPQPAEEPTTSSLPPPTHRSTSPQPAASEQQQPGQPDKDVPMTQPQQEPQQLMELLPVTPPQDPAEMTEEPMTQQQEQRVLTVSLRKLPKRWLDQGAIDISDLMTLMELMED